MALSGNRCEECDCHDRRRRCIRGLIRLLGVQRGVNDMGAGTGVEIECVAWNLKAGSMSWRRRPYAAQRGLSRTRQKNEDTKIDISATACMDRSAHLFADLSQCMPRAIVSTTGRQAGTAQETERPLLIGSPQLLSARQQK